MLEHYTSSFEITVRFKGNRLHMHPRSVCEIKRSNEKEEKVTGVTCDACSIVGSRTRVGLHPTCS